MSVQFSQLKIAPPASGSHAFEAFRRSESRFCRRSRSAAVPGGTPFPFRRRSRSLPFQPRAFSAVPFSLPFRCSAAVPVPLLPPFPFCRRSRSPPFPFRAVPVPFRFPAVPPGTPFPFPPFRAVPRSRSRSRPFPFRAVPVPLESPFRENWRIGELSVPPVRLGHPGRPPTPGVHRCGESPVEGRRWGPNAAHITRTRGTTSIPYAIRRTVHSLQGSKRSTQTTVVRPSTRSELNCSVPAPWSPDR